MTLEKQEILRRLHHLDEYDFEHFVAKFWERRGWNTKVTTGSNDRGIDVIATRKTPYNEKEVIQAKRYRPENRVGSPELQQYASLSQQEQDADKVIVICTSGFTDSALSIAEDTNVKCIDGATLAGMVSDQDATDLVEKYTDPVSEQIHQEDELSQPQGSNDKDTKEAKGDGEETTFVDRGDDLVAELVGMERIETTISSKGLLADDVTLDGVLCALKFFNQRDIAIVIESLDAFSFTDDSGGTYTPINLGAGELNNNWQKHGGRTTIDGLWVEPGERTKYAVGVSLPAHSKITQITLDRYDIKFTLDYEARRKLPDLPKGIKSAVGD